MRTTNYPNARPLQPRFCRVSCLFDEIDLMGCNARALALVAASTSTSVLPRRFAQDSTHSCESRSELIILKQYDPSMNNIFTRLQSMLLLFSLPFVSICHGQETSELKGENSSTITEGQLKNHGNPASQPDPLRISDYIRRIFQDREGHLWLGTNGDGVCRYDGDSLKYYSIDEGFGGFAVRGIVEDRAGNVWFGTDRGITKFDGTSFANFSEADGLIGNDVWSIAIDSKGIIWIGTLEGVSRFDGTTFTRFEIPESEPDYTRGVTSANIVHCILEDSKGRMWFATNGGAYVFDGESLTNISEKDGLCSNSVNDILEDAEGNFWFATYHNGVCRWDGESFTHIGTKDGVHGTEAWKLYADQLGNVWFPIEHSGLYRYDGKEFTNFHRKQGLNSEAIQCFLEDREGRVWVGGVFGLFRFDGKSFFQVTKEGPWK